MEPMNALWLFILAVLLAFNSLLSTPNVVGGQDSTPPVDMSGGPIDAFTFYIPYRADILR